MIIVVVSFQLTDFVDKANFYVMAAVTFFRSDWPEIRSNAAMFTGKTVL